MEFRGSEAEDFNKDDEEFKESEINFKFRYTLNCFLYLFITEVYKLYFIPFQNFKNKYLKIRPILSLG